MSSNIYDPSTKTLVPIAGNASNSLNMLDDVALSAPSNGQVLTYDAANQVWKNATSSGGGGGGGGSTTVLSQTLSAGSTSVTFTEIPTTGDYLIDFYTSNGINYTAIDNSVVGQVTLTFETQANNVTVFCEIKGVTT